MKDKIKRFAQMVKESQKIVFFGGAGVSTESGLKDYRSRDGIYNTCKKYGIPPEEILSIDFFWEHPETFFEFYREYFISDALPNKAHTAGYTMDAAFRGMFCGSSMVTAQRIVHMYRYGYHHIEKPT